MQQTYYVVERDEKEFARATEDTRMGHIKRESLPKSTIDFGFTFEIVLRFGNGLNEELCCRFIFTNLQ